MSMSRNKNHEYVMKTLYVVLTYKEINLDFDLKTVISDIFESDFDLIEEQSKLIIVRALLHHDEIVSKLTPLLNKWEWKRIPNLSKAILLMAYTHYYFVEKIDKAIIINYSIKLSKKYLDSTDYKFINVILDKVLC